MNDLPPGWAKATLVDVCDIVSGSTPKTSEPSYWGGDIAWVTPDDLSRDRAQHLIHGARFLTQAGYGSCSAQLVPAGSVVFSSRAPIGYVAIAGGPLCTSQGCKTAVPPDGLEPRYLYWYLQWRTPEIESRASGTTFREISGRRFAETELLLPPVAEQRRIVDALEAHFSRSDKATDALANALTRLRSLRTSALAEATSVPAAPADRAGWTTLSIGDMATVGSGATPLRSRLDYYAGGSIPWVTSGQLAKPHVLSADQHITPRALEETAVRLWPAGTLLVAMYGEGKTRGRCSELAFEATTNQACAAIALDREYADRRPWLKLYLQAKYEAMRRLAAGGVQPNLSLGVIKKMTIPLPPTDIQARRLSIASEWVASTDRLRDDLQRRLELVGTLRQALAAAAFSGRLAPQDPNDEPAELLLKRIQAERATEAPRTRRTRKAKATP